MERMVQIPYRRGSVDTPHPFCPVEDGSNPRGVEMHRTTRTPLFWARERERERDREREREGRAQWERNREEQQER